jgi:hypothetical protein
MKRTVAIVMAVAFLLALAGAAYAVADTIQLSKGGKAKVVNFTHKAHQGYAPDCKKCHHTGENNKCSTCHTGDGSKGGGKNAKEALHKNCIGCHKDGGKGPTTCSGCHTG